MHPNEVDGRVRALSTRVRTLLAERDTFDSNDEDDRDAGVAVRREPRHPNNAGGIAVPEPEDDERLNLTSQGSKLLPSTYFPL